MVTQSVPPAAIEGDKILVTGQDIKPDGLPIYFTNPDDMVFPLRVKKRGDAVITEEKKQKIAGFRKYSKLELNDRISGKWLWGFSSDPIRSGDIKVGGRGRTSNHPGQELVIEGICLMEIIKWWNNYSLSILPKDEPIKRLPKKNKLH